MQNGTQTATVPPAILDAAARLLQPYAPHLTPSGLAEALASCSKDNIEKPLSFKEASSILGVSRATLARWVTDGKLHAAHVSRKCVRIPAADVRALLEA